MFRIVLAILMVLPALSVAAEVQFGNAEDKAFLLAAPPSELAWSDDQARTILRFVMDGTAQGRFSTATSLQFFQKLANRRRGGPITEQAQQLAKIARRNLAEERDRADACVRVLFKPTTQERVADLIYYLRYSSRRFREFHPERNIDLDRLLSLAAPRRRLGDSSRNNIACWLGDVDAVDALAAVGADAVPQLLDKLGDETLLRRLRPSPNYYSSKLRSSARVGDVAGCALNAIAGRQVVETPFVEGGGFANAHQAATAWWKEHQRKGDKQMLIEGVERADHFSPIQAAMLVRRHPDDALPAIRQALREFTDAEARCQLIRLVQFIPTDEAERFLMEQLTATGPDERFAAAQALWARRQAPPALAAVIKDWRAVERDDKNEGSQQHTARLRQFLVQSHDPAAIRELTAAFVGCNDPGRVEFVRELAQEAARRKSFSEETLSELERLFLLGLDVASEENESGFFSSGIRCVDWAALGLCRTWNIKPIVEEGPSWFEYEPNAPPPWNGAPRPTFRERLRQIALVRNESRRRRGLPPLTAPEFPQETLVRWSAIEPLLRRFADEKTDEGRQAVATKIKALGIGALPRVNHFLKGLTEDHPARDELRALAGCLSFAVRDVRTLEGTMDLPDDLRRELDKWRGKVPTEGEIEQLADYFCKRTPSGVVGRMLIERPNDDTGAVIWVAWRADRPPIDPPEFEQSICVRATIDSGASWHTVKFADGRASTRTSNWDSFAARICSLYSRSTQGEALIAISSVIRGR
jgi:hypothetical protein